MLALLACGLVAAAPAPGNAQLHAGQVEVGLLVGGGAAAAGDERPQFLLLRTLGFLLTDAWELGVGAGLSGNFESAPSTAIEADAAFHLAPAAAIVPYAAVHVGFEADVFTASPRIEETLGPSVGAKWRCWENLLLLAELRYTMQAARPERGVILLSLGFTLLEDPEVETPEADQAH